MAVTTAFYSIVGADTKGLEGNKGHINTTCDQTLADTNVTPVVRFHKMTKKMLSI